MAEERGGARDYLLHDSARRAERHVAKDHAAHDPNVQGGHSSSLWPSEGPNDTNHYPHGYQYVIAADWGFSLRFRAFVASGCGMDMVFWLIDHLAHKAAHRVESEAAQEKELDRWRQYANRVHRTQIGG